MSVDLFLDCFAADMPGVVTATWSVSNVSYSARMQFWAEPRMDLDLGEIRSGQILYRAEAPTAWLTGVKQATKLTIDGASYTVAAKPMDDGHGVSTLILERSRA